MGFALSKMQLKSDAFEQNQPIPKNQTGEGADVSPALEWSGAPVESKSFAIICHDPDAPLVRPGSYGFVHWVLYNLPASTSSLSEGTNAGTQGVNDFGNEGYGGPMPPEGHGTHHYYFWVLALDADLNLKPGLTLWKFLEQAESSIIAMNRLVGTYERT